MVIQICHQIYLGAGLNYLINLGNKDQSVTMTMREKDELEELMKSFKELGLSPDGINIEERRRRLLSLLAKHEDEMDEKDRVTRLVLDFRALQRTLKVKR